MPSSSVSSALFIMIVLLLLSLCVLSADGHSNTRLRAATRPTLPVTNSRAIDSSTTPSLNNPHRHPVNVSSSVYWQTSTLQSVIYANDYLFVAVSEPNESVHVLHKRTDQVYGAKDWTVTLNPLWSVQTLYASNTSIYAVAAQRYGAGLSVLQIDCDTLYVHTNTTIQLDVGQQMYGVNAAGTVMLVATPRDNKLLLVDTKKGYQLGSVDGGHSNLKVACAAFSPVTGDVIVFDHTTSSVFVIQPSTNSVTASAVIPSSSYQAVLSMAVDQAGASLYVYYVGAPSDTGAASVFLYFDLTAHNLNAEASMSFSYYESPYLPLEGFTAGRMADTLYFINYYTNRLYHANLENNTVLEQWTGPSARPPLRSPSGVATSFDGRYIYMALFDDSDLQHGVFQLDRNGTVLRRAFVGVSCLEAAAQTVSVDVQGHVYLPLCNGSVAVYRDFDLALIQMLNLHNVLPRTATPSTNHSVYVIQMARFQGETALVAEYSLHTGEMLQQIMPVNQSSMSDITVDVTDSSIWLAAYQILHHFQPNGTLISAWNATMYGNHTYWAVSIDYTRHAVVVSYGPSLLWLDVVSGEVVFRYNITSDLTDSVGGVSISPDGSTVYATLILDNTVLELHMTGHVNASSGSHSTARATPTIRDNRLRVKHVVRVA